VHVQLQTTEHLISRIFGREDVGSASPLPALLPWVLGWWGRSVGGLGPGLTSESAGAARAVLRSPCRPGPRFQVPTGAAGLICLAWARGRGSQVRRPAGACHPSTLERDDVTIASDACHYWWRGHPCRYACGRRAGFHRRAARRPGVPGHGSWLRVVTGLAGRVRDGVPGRDRRYRQLRRGPVPARHRSRYPRHRGRPL